MYLAALALSSVVYLERQAAGQRGGLGTGETGTGFVIASTPRVSYILTAAHVLGCGEYGDHCSSTIALRFSDSPARVWQAERTYSGAALGSDDLAILLVHRGNLAAFPIADAHEHQSLTEIGYPQSLVRRLAHVKTIRLKPRALRGAINAHLTDGRELLSLSSEPGDSGAPLVNERGAVVGVLQGKQDRDHDIAIGATTVRAMVSPLLLTLRERLGNPTNDPDNRARAYMLYLNVLHVARQLQDRQVYIGKSAFEQIEDQLYGEALDAGSLNAAIALLSTFGERGFGDLPLSPSGFDSSLSETTRRGSILTKALQLAVTAVKSRNSAATYAIYKYLSSSPPPSGSRVSAAEAASLENKYLQMAADLGNPYALDDLAAKTTDHARQIDLMRRAMRGYELLMQQGDADAAERYSLDYTTANEDLLSIKNAAVATDQNTWYAARLGSIEAITKLLDQLQNRALPAQQAEALGLAVKAVQRGYVGGASRVLAGRVGDAYALGKLVPRDPLRALDFYALADFRNEDELEKKLIALVPAGAGYTGELQTSHAYQKAADAVVQLKIVDSEGRESIASGTVVHSDSRRSIIVTTSIAMGCDAYLLNCSKVECVEWAGGQNFNAYLAPGFPDSICPSDPKNSVYDKGHINIVYASGASIESGIVLIEMGLPNAKSVSVANAVPEILISSGEGGSDSTVSSKFGHRRRPYWGILRGKSADDRVITFDLPIETLFLGAGIFDYSTGDLVGIFSDPYDARRATGPTAIREALAAIGIP